jgi:DNA modification methylase
MLARESATLPVAQILVGHAAKVMAGWPSRSVDLVVTSPPYWNAVAYDGLVAPPWGTGARSYEDYLKELQTVWVECARVLRPAGKLCINAPLLPIEQKRMRQDTRVLKDIAGDIGRGILAGTDLRLFDQFIWQKQTSERMLGTYPYPGHNYANNTVEFITVYVKPGKRKDKTAPAVKVANRMPDALHRNLTQQVWFMMPTKINRDRAKDHPSPFPELLPARLIRLYTFGAADEFAGEIVLDPFCGTGTTCVAAKRMGRRFIGIDRVEKYAAEARERLARTTVDGVDGPTMLLLVSTPKQQGRSALEATWKSLLASRLT